MTKPLAARGSRSTATSDFDAKAQAICRLYLDAPRLYQQGRLLICCDEKTGMQILQRKYPTIPARPGKPEKREFEYIRLGTRTLIASFAVATGRFSTRAPSTYVRARPPR